MGNRILREYRWTERGNDQEYIREQEKQDMLEDKLTTKEYDDPFKGSR